MSFVYSSRTQKGLLSNNPKKYNQDNFIAIPNFTLDSSSHLFSVCDGHGENGHLVSLYIKENFPSMKFSKKQFFIIFHKEILKKNLSKSPINKILIDSVSELQNKLSSSSIDVAFSGSTMIVVYIQNNTIYISNVGDSRAILGRQNCNDLAKKWQAIALSEDQKPDLSKEKERIEKRGGIVVSRKHSDKTNDGNVCRAWIPHKKVFGLSMSRSLGDLIAKNYGIISDPGKFFTEY